MQSIKMRNTTTPGYRSSSRQRKKKGHEDTTYDTTRLSKLGTSVDEMKEADE